MHLGTTVRTWPSYLSLQRGSAPQPHRGLPGPLSPLLCPGYVLEHDHSRDKTRALPGCTGTAGTSTLWAGIICTGWIQAQAPGPSSQPPASEHHQSPR